MRNELLESYKLAVETKDHDVIKQFQKIRDRVGPAIVIDECMKVDKLTEELEELRKLTGELFRCIRTSHLDMSGKHRYDFKCDAYKVIEPLRQLVYKDQKMISKFGIGVEQDEGAISMKETGPQNIDINTKSVYYNGQMRLVRHIKEWLTDEAIDNGCYCDQTVIDMRDCIYILVKQLELERYIRTSQYGDEE